jgi:hypothetical protein
MLKRVEPTRLYRLTTAIKIHLKPPLRREHEEQGSPAGLG